MYHGSFIFKFAIVFGCLLLASCSTHSIKVITYPSDATVEMGGHECQSPCELPVESEFSYVTASLPDGRSKKVTIPESMVEPQKFSDRLLFHLGDLSYLGGLSFAAMGYAAVELFFNDLDNNNSDHELTGEIGVFSIVALATSYALLKLGNQIGNMERPVNQLEIDFGANTTPTP